MALLLCSNANGESGVYGLASRTLRTAVPDYAYSLTQAKYLVRKEPLPDNSKATAGCTFFKMNLCMSCDVRCAENICSLTSVSNLDTNFTDHGF